MAQSYFQFNEVLRADTFDAHAAPVMLACDVLCDFYFFESSLGANEADS
jgi:hypothetical protein